MFHDDFLYKDQTELVEKLCFLIQNYSQFTEKQRHLSVAMERFAWENMIDKYDEMLKNLALKWSGLVHDERRFFFCPDTCSLTRFVKKIIHSADIECLQWKLPIPQIVRPTSLHTSEHIIQRFR